MEFVDLYEKQVKLCLKVLEEGDGTTHNFHTDHLVGTLSSANVSIKIASNDGLALHSEIYDGITALKEKLDKKAWLKTNEDFKI